MEQKFGIKFCFKIGLKWYIKRFEEGCENVEDDKRSGRVEHNRRSTISKVADDVGFWV